ncbi:RRP12-like protein [Caerostris extrusa]|uniref:RRP12-like protein n=1 Tax=Caerostris extrusa TaxID=172846 RepID=A0AAV4U7Z4_CAEEX|nr:RRP12-like protein [Caerostris extrusa]
MKYIHFFPSFIKAKILQQEGRLVESKLFEVVCLQIWSLLPGFCTEPTDLTMCFKDVAPKLGKLLNDDKLGQFLPLKLTILNSLRLLIKNEEHKGEMSKYAKNYIPILFNLYLTETKNKEEEKIRLAVYETCKLYIQIADRTLITIYFQTGMQKMRSSESKDFILHGTLDVCKAMISCIDGDQIKELYEYTKPLLQNENNTTKKKIYSLIKEICSSESESCKSFIKSHLSDLRLLLSETMNGLTPATRALRLNCLEHLVSQSTIDEKSTVVDIIPEAVLCTKENSVKARAAAYSLLILIGHALHKFTPDNPKGCLKEYMTYLLAGLAGNPHFISATVLAIGRVMYEFKDELDSDIISNLISIMCELVKAKSREIVVSALSFFKILFATVDANVLQPHVKTMISSLTSIASDNQRAFRFKAKELFTRLVRKFGYEMISKMMPPNYQKQLNNIRKIEARKQNKKERQNYGDEEEDDSDLEIDLLADSDDDIIDDNVKVKASKSRSKKLKAQFFQEDAEDNIVDLLDPVTCNRSLTVKTENQMKRKRQNDDFKLSADGRLIIEDEDDGKKSELKSKDENNLLSDVIEPLQKRKRKFDDSDDEADKTNSAPLVHKGIHRTLESKAKRRCPGEEFKAKKAGGDIKKGKLEPYAYVPFNKMALNKRKQMKLKGQFKNFVNAAKRGASVGMKRKKENRKRL